MKRINIYYWTSTGIVAAMMLASSIPNILSVPDAVTMVVTHLGYPAYFLPFIGVCKLLGVVGIIVPGPARLKDWAYAGLTFDLIAAMYSMYSVGDPVSTWLPVILPVVLLIASNYFFHERIKASARS
jgi:hypothetical protein